VRAEHRTLLDLICGLDLKPLPKVASVPRGRQLVIQVGKGSRDARHDVVDLITFAGRAAGWTASAAKFVNGFVAYVGQRKGS
jgi:hypothetical protein